MKIRNKKLIPFGLGIVAVLAMVGTVGVLSGWFGGAANIVPEDTMTRGLVGYWGMDEGSGTTTADISGNNNTAVALTAAATPQWAQGKVGGALSFDGTDDYINVAHNSSLSPSAISVEAWVKLDAVGRTNIIINKYQDDNNQYGLYVNNTNTFRFVVGNGTTYAIAASTDTASAGVWYHMIGTFDGSTAKIYVSGAEKDAELISGLSAGTGVLGIGSSPANPGYPQGLIDEVRVYNRALSAEEVRYHYNRGGPVGWWKFDEGASTTAYDSSGNGNTGTLTNMNVTTATSSWVTGRHGTALSFDGVNDYVGAGMSSTDFTSMDFTVGVWVNKNVSVAGSNRLVVSRVTGANERGWWLNIDGQDGVDFRTFPGNVQTIGGSGLLGKWYYVVVVRTGSAAKIFINGIESTASRGNHSAFDGTNATVKIGIHGDNSSYPFNGEIDDVRVYNYARTGEEIRLDYNAGLAALFGPQGSCDLDPGSCMTKGLMGYWGMDEEAGTTTADISGNNNTGVFATAASSPAWTNGKVGGALSFDGSNDYFDAGSNSILEITGDISAEYWVKADSLVGDYVVIFRRGATDTDGYGVTISSTGRIYLAFDTPTGHQHIYSGAGEITTGSWYHVVITRINGVGHIYKNGVELSGVTSEAAKTPSPSSRSAKIGIYDDGASYAFDGIIDDLKIYNRALSAEEVRYHYNRGGPVGWWKFDEGASTTAYDASGNGNTGTLTNMNVTTATSSWTTGKYGTALNFDGVDDYVRVTDSDSLDVIDAITISAWIYPLTMGENGYGRVVSKGTSDGYELYLRLSDPANALTFRSDTNGITQNSNANSIILNVWQHIVVTYDKQKVKFYVNGIYQGGGVETGSISANARDLYVGEGVETTNRTFNGEIDDVRVYNYARTPDEIRLDYNAGLAAYFGPSTISGTSRCDDDPGSCMTKGLVGYWAMDEGIGTTTADISGSGNTGVFITGTFSPQWAKGKIGGALSFDGTDDYVSAYNGASLDITSAITLEAWVYYTGSATYPRFMRKDGEEYALWKENTRWRFQIEQNGGVGANAQTALNTVQSNVWVHLVGTFDGTDIKIYMDGELKATTNSPGAIDSAPSSNFTFGASPYFQGLIDEARIYNRALSAEEVRYHYNRGGPVGWWKFDEGASTTAYDSSGNGNTGTLTNMNVTTATSSWVLGKYGSALNFDGLNDYVSTPITSAAYTAATQEAWIKTDVGGGQGRIVSKGGGRFSLQRYTANTIIWQLTTAGGNLGANLTASFQESVWTHVAATYDGVTAKLYINGELKKSLGGVSGAIEDTGDNLSIGADSGGNIAFRGLIDDVRVYNYARTPAQILQDYNQGLSVYFK